MEQTSIIPEIGIKWRPYQHHAFEAIHSGLKSNVHRQLVVMATGTGKRLIAVGLSKWFKRVLFLCHRQELIEQAFKEFEAVYPLEVGIIKGSRDERDKKIVVASSQTIWRRLEEMPEDMFDCIIADEVHHYLARTFIMPLKHFKPKLSVGFTATPYRLDGLNFSNIVDEIIFDYSIEQGIKEGFLCGLDAWRTKTAIDISKIKKVAGDFNQADLSLKVNIEQRNRFITQKYQEYADGRPAVAFCVDIQHAIDLADMFIQQGITAAAVHSNMDDHERAQIIERFKVGRIQVLTNVEILTEGWDHNDVGAILMARPTQSLALYMQMIGRGTRLKSKVFRERFGRNDCKIVDFVDLAGKHNLINTWTLEKDKPLKDRIFMSDERKADAQMKLDLAKQQREHEIEKMHLKDKKIDILTLPSITIRRYTERMMEAATEKQLDWLKKVGLYLEGVEYTKGQASEMIQNMPAEDWQIRQLAKWGYDVIGHEILNGHYYKAKQEIESKGKVNQPFV